MCRDWTWQPLQHLTILDSQKVPGRIYSLVQDRGVSHGSGRSQRACAGYHPSKRTAQPQAMVREQLWKRELSGMVSEVSWRAWRGNKTGPAPTNAGEHEEWEMSGTGNSLP